MLNFNFYCKRTEQKFKFIYFVETLIVTNKKLINFFQVDDNLPGPQQRTFSSDQVPSIPGSPKAVNITNSNVTLAWSRSQDKSRSHTPLTYTVEQFSPDSTSDDLGWTVALRGIAGNTATVTGLSPEVSYIFAVRAENAFGYSAPSPLSAPIRTLSSDDRVTVPEEMEMARSVLNGKVSFVCSRGREWMGDGFYIRCDPGDVFRAT